MSTNALYTFSDDENSVTVYGHWDGYPVGAAEMINNAFAHAWELPRFEADEFGAAFVAGNKDGAGQGGHIRLVSNPDIYDGQYHYYITQTAKNQVLMVHAYEGGEHIISCSQEAFMRHAIEWRNDPEAYAEKHRPKNPGIRSRRKQFEPIEGVDY